MSTQKSHRRSMVAENQFLTFSSHNLGDNKFRQSTLNCKQIKNAWVEQIFFFYSEKVFLRDSGHIYFHGIHIEITNWQGKATQQCFNVQLARFIDNI